MSSEPMNLPDEIVERAARMLYNGSHVNGTDWWATSTDDERTLARVKAKAVLATALDGADVEVRARVRVETTLLPPHDSEPPIVTWLTWCSAAAAEEEAARCRITHPGSSYFVEQQLVIMW